MRIANVALDGGRAYGPRLLLYLRANRPDRPDIVTLQKVGPRDCFPTEELGKLGYESWPLWKQDSSDLGVAVLSLRRRSLPEPKVLCCELPGGKKQEARFLTVKIGGLWVSSVYAPFGPMKPDEQEAIHRRVAWLNRLRQHVCDKRFGHRAALLCGDFNVKLDEKLGKTGDFTCYEQRELRALLTPDMGFVDLYRQQHPDLKKLGGTRGYKEKTPEGTSRLHLILASGSLARRVRDARLDRPDIWPRPDAPPLIVEFEDIGA